MSDFRKGSGKHGNGMLMWNQSTHFEHHCAICHQPLSSSKARQTCIGVHCEPCSRFHQHMFRKDRGRSCKSCKVIREDHRQRHRELAELVRTIRETCGADPAIPVNINFSGERYHDNQAPKPLMSEESERNGHFKTSDSPDDCEIDGSHGRKWNVGAQNSTRPSNRPGKVLTSVEVDYVEDVLHRSSLADEYPEGELKNMKDVEHFEQGLRNCTAKLNINISEPDPFDKSMATSEFKSNLANDLLSMEAILGINDFIRQNAKNRGLFGKALRDFENLILTFRTHVVNDLILSKRDKAETNMRKAAFIRYAGESALPVTQCDEVRDQRTPKSDPDTIEMIGSGDREENTESAPSMGPHAERDQRHLHQTAKRIVQLDETSGFDINKSTSLEQEVPPERQEEKSPQGPGVGQKALTLKVNPQLAPSPPNYTAVTGKLRRTSQLIRRGLNRASCSSPIVRSNVSYSAVVAGQASASYPRDTLPVSHVPPFTIQGLEEIGQEDNDSDADSNTYKSLSDSTDALNSQDGVDTRPTSLLHSDSPVETSLAEAGGDGQVANEVKQPLLHRTAKEQSKKRREAERKTRRRADNGSRMKLQPEPPAKAEKPEKRTPPAYTRLDKKQRREAERRARAAEAKARDEAHKKILSDGF